MHASSPIPVLLLKTKSTPKDGYAELFTQPAYEKYEHYFVPVLEHFFNAQSLGIIQERITKGAFNKPAADAEQYGGLIFTSQRAVEAFIKVIGNVRNSGVDLDILLPDSVPLYVVGPATARSLATLELKCPIIGEESGNGENLAAFMLKDYNAKATLTPSGVKPGLLFLVGEQRRDIIPKTLQNTSLPAGETIKVDELTVYETGVMESFPQDFKNHLDAVPASVPLQWVVVFSPTGCRAMLEVLGMLDPVSGKVSNEHQNRYARKTLIATIGPTTRDYLIRTFDFTPDAVAEKPSPEGVMAAIEAKTPDGV